jgi:transcription elongation factor GreA
MPCTLFRKMGYNCGLNQANAHRLHLKTAGGVFVSMRQLARHDVMDRIPMTREGYDKRKARLDNMENVQMIEVARRIATAREMGDLSENAEYHAAREDQGILQARIDSLKDELSRAYFVDPNNVKTDAVVFGTRVKVKDLELGDEESFDLVGPGDEDYDKNKILTSSPIGQGLLGKKKGDIAEIAVPMGKLRFEIVEISLPDE